MRQLALRYGCACLLLTPALSLAQEASKKDARGLAVLQQALAASGGSWPADVIATGRVTLAGGSDIRQGTITLQLLGYHRSMEESATSEGTRKVTHSRDLAAQKQGDQDEPLSLELAATTQSAILPVPLLLSFANGSDGIVEYVALEDVNGEKAHHLRLAKSFAARPKLAHLTEFTAREAWIAEKSGLPLRMTFQRRSARGAVAAIEVEVTYSEYRQAAGLLLPHRIEEKLNGTLWRTIELDRITLNNGLTDAAFSLPSGRRAQTEVRP